ncbi:MAG: LegC family aminotransferase [Saprospiraceae bacterium]|nr:LegC family aminotransferase [Saprospiraceae bacterium]
MILLSGPNISGNEWKYVKDCLDTQWVSSVGSYVNKFEQMVAEFAGCKYGVAASNGTSALHISLELLGVKRNDYVIVPNVTFIASLNSIKYTKADPILMDIDPETWQMDLNLLEEFLENDTYIKGNHSFLKKNNRRIPAIMPVHVLGNMCDMDKLTGIATRYKLHVVEDATEALGSYFNNRHSGSFGILGSFSFNGNKIITTGGGGVIVTNDEDLAKRAKHLTTQAKCDPFEYIHDEIGYNYRLVNVLAAMGVAQMEQLPDFIKRKHEIDTFYKNTLSSTGDISFQKVLPEVNPNYWLFTFKTKKQKELLKILNEKKCSQDHSGCQ